MRGKDPSEKDIPAMTKEIYDKALNKHMCAKTTAFRKFLLYGDGKPKRDK